jgi:hypothetical protein
LATRITVHASPLLLQRGVRGVTGQPLEIVVHFPTSPALSAQGFEVDSALPGPTLLACLPAMVRAASERPEARLVLFGHADESGGDEHNKRLSDRRAKAVLALLTQDLGAFDALAREDEWAQPQYRLLLAALGVTESAAGRGLRSFQRQYNAGDYHRGNGRERAYAPLKVDGLLGPRTEAALRDAYLAQLPVSLDRARFIGPKTAGCGEFNRLGSPEQDRRVVLALYRADFPTESKIPCKEGDAASCKINKKARHGWKCNFYRRTVEVEQPCAPQEGTAPAASRLIQLQDADGQVLAKHAFQLVFEDGETLEGASDAAGWVDVPLNVNESCRLRVGEVTYLIRMAAEVSDLEEQQSRLNALGFEAGEVSGKRTKGTERATNRYRESIGAAASDAGDEQLLAQLRSESQGVA